MTKRELERQLRRVHPHRSRSRRRRRRMAPTKRRMQALFGVIFGLGLVALLGAVHLVTRDPASTTAGQQAAWGQSYKRTAVHGEHHTSRHASLFPERKRPYNPRYDPRQRRAQQRRRAMFRY